MGWYFGSSSRAAVIDELTRPYSSPPVSRTTLAKFTSGNTLWTVEEVTNTETGVVQRFIGCYLMAGRQGSANGWGYKPMEESMGPVQISCPLKFLEMTPVADAEWREKVKAFHARRRSILGLKPGETVRLIAGCSINGQRIEEGRVVSMRPLIVDTKAGRAKLKPSHVDAEASGLI